MLKFPSHEIRNNFSDNLIISVIHITEYAAIAASRFRGKYNEKLADQAAVDAMRYMLNQLPIYGTIVIGEGERDSAPMLYIGEKIGKKNHEISCDIAIDPLEGTTLCAKNQSNALSVIALSEKNNILHAPDVYMKKIAIGPNYPKDIINIDNTPSKNIKEIAKAKKVSVNEITVCVIDRPRHSELIKEILSTGASVYLISDGDIAGIMYTTNSEKTGIDIYMGIGGAPEGVLSAAALKCVGGQMQGILNLTSEQEILRSKNMGINDPKKIYSLEEMVKGNVLFSATGVTDGRLLSGVKFRSKSIETNTIFMNSYSKRIYNIKTEHKNFF